MCVRGHSPCEFMHDLYIAELYRPGSFYRWQSPFSTQCDPEKLSLLLLNIFFFSKIDARIFVTPGRVLPTRGRCVCVSLSLPAVARTGAFDPIRLYRSLYTIPGQALQNFTAQGQLLWNANRKPHPSFPLNDPSYFKVTSLFDADLINGTIYIVTMKY